MPTGEGLYPDFKHMENMSLPKYSGRLLVSYLLTVGLGKPHINVKN